MPEETQEEVQKFFNIIKSKKYLSDEDKDNGESEKVQNLYKCEDSGPNNIRGNDSTVGECKIQEMDDIEPGIVSKIKTRTKLQRSPVHDYFSYNDSTNQSQCQLCGAFMTGKNPTGLKSHLNSKHMSEYNEVVDGETKGRTGLTAESYLCEMNEDQNIDRDISLEERYDETARVIVNEENNIPFSFVTKYKLVKNPIHEYFNFNSETKKSVCSCCEYEMSGKNPSALKTHLKSKRELEYNIFKDKEDYARQKLIFQKEGIKEIKAECYGE